jgi:selenocysteine lyase/cysteine desulfurase
VHPDKLAPSANTVPERFEFGTLPYELLAGTTAAVDFLAGLVPTAGSRRASLEQSMAAVEKQESELLSELEAGLRQIDGVDIRSRAPRRTPTVLFTVADLASAAVSRALADVGVNAPAGSFYAPDCARVLGLGDLGGVRAGIGLYTDSTDVERLVAAVAALRR